MKIKRIAFEKILPILLFIVMVVRIFSSETILINSEFTGLESSFLDSKFLTVMCLLGVWFGVAAVLLAVMRPFFNIKVINNLTRFVAPVIFIVNLILCSNTIYLLTGKEGFNLTLLLFIIENSIGLIISIYYFIKDFKVRLQLKQVFFMFLIFFLLLIPSLPIYLIQVMFGTLRDFYLPNDLSFTHRILLYIAILVPYILFRFLVKKEEQVINFTLIFISLAVMIGFIDYFDYTVFKSPWDLPFHLCNTALFIIPLCLVFKMKRLFYFTYFINVIGALLAMVMPNYGDALMFSASTMRFWYNHWVAFFMPILAVALNVFKRPKLKEFIYSMIAFFVYFILVLFLNVYFTAYLESIGSTSAPDFFFLNSDFIADKLGKWAEDIFRIEASFDVGGFNLVFHPVYQVIFFFVYVLFGLGEWFIYSEFYRIMDDHQRLHDRLEEIKLHEYAYLSRLSPEQKENMMNRTTETKLVLTGFSKKYGNNTFYSVKDANLDVRGGEIFGFLGPNGAGKSTIIKSIVGIQPITEGSIDVCGYDVQVTPTEAKYNIGYVPDHYALYEKLTGREYINYIADIFEVSTIERNERLEKYVKIFQLEHAIDNKIGSYSHGMKQKITIMAALVHNPRVWILDEPLTGLDPNSIYQVKECMKIHASEGNIVFFSSHLIDIVEKLCQRIAIIKKGEIQCIKTLEEIEASGQTLEQFYLSVIENNEDNTGGN